MTETLQLPALQVQAPGDWEENGSSGTTSGDPAGPPSTPPSPSQSPASSPSLRRKRFKMRRMKNVQSEREVADGSSPGNSGSKEYLQLPSIEITPSSDEDAAWSNCSTPSASPRRKRFLLRKWLRGGDKKEQSSESSSQQSSIQSSHEEDTTRYLTPNIREER
ncbi:hypothetical protein SRHO_G00214040 [Serrasalmus rhombeus]